MSGNLNETYLQLYNAYVFFFFQNFLLECAQAQSYVTLQFTWSKMQCFEKWY